MTLRWNKPSSDGGRPIDHYIIQKKDEFGGWFEALVTNDANCCATIAELEALEKDNEVARQQADSGPGSCEDRTRTSVTDSLKRKLKDVMKEFADLREQFREEHREVWP